MVEENHRCVNEDVAINILDNPIKMVCTLAYEKYGTIYLTPNGQKLVWCRHWFFDEEGDKKITWKRQLLGLRPVYSIYRYEVSSYVDKDQEVWYFWKHMMHAMDTNNWCGLVINDKDADGSKRYSLVDVDGMVIYDVVLPQHIAKVMYSNNNTRHQ